VIDALSRTVVAWYADECEDAKVTAKLVSRACLKERFSRRRKQLLILHADNGNALTVGLAQRLRASTLEVRLENWVCSDPSSGRV
jgi:hypothetical protein